MGLFRGSKAKPVFWYLVQSVAVLLFVLVKDAHSYIDPGSGSYVIQMLMAVLLGAMLAVKMFWQRLKAYISNLFSRRPDSKDKEK